MDKKFEGKPVLRDIEICKKCVYFDLNTYQAYKRDAANRQQIGRTGFTQGGNLRAVLKSPEVELTSSPRTITHTFTLPRAAELVHPEIVLLGAGNMTVTKFSIELLPPR